jgi:hypothetical protein
VKHTLQATLNKAGFSLHRKERIDDLLLTNTRLSSELHQLQQQNDQLIEKAVLVDSLSAENSSLHNKYNMLLHEMDRLKQENAATVENNLTLATKISDMKAREGRDGWAERYMAWTSHVFGRPVIPICDMAIKAVASFPTDSPYFKPCEDALFQAEVTYASDLLVDIQKHDVPGQVVEFGIYKGAWINRLNDLMLQAGLKRELWGFDSFQGLSKPSESFDDPYWKEGMFSAGMEEVLHLVKADQRPYIKLIPGFFSSSLISEAAKTLKEVCYARIDCDIYEPCVECLHYLAPRLSHGAVLVFDDWSHNMNIGETRAFREWTDTVPHLEFEFLFFGYWDHFYLRVWHKDKARWPLASAT